MVTVLGEAKPRVKNIMTLGSCAAIVGAEVRAVGGWLWCSGRITGVVAVVANIMKVQG
jgi:hypothetical protein